MYLAYQWFDCKWFLHAFLLFSNEMLRCSNPCCFQFPFCTQRGWELDHRYLLWPKCRNAVNSETGQNMVRGTVSNRSLSALSAGGGETLTWFSLTGGSIALYVVADAQRISFQPRRLFWLIRLSHQTHFRNRSLWENIPKLATKWMIDCASKFWIQNLHSSYSSYFRSFCLRCSLFSLSGQSSEELPA